MSIHYLVSINPILYWPLPTFSQFPGLFPYLYITFLQGLGLFPYLYTKGLLSWPIPIPLYSKGREAVCTLTVL